MFKIFFFFKCFSNCFGGYFLQTIFVKMGRAAQNLGGVLIR